MKRPQIYIILFGIILRVAMFWVDPLWYDEDYSLILARLPLADMAHAIAGDVHPPLWYSIIWGLVHLVHNAPAWIIRIPSLIFSSAAMIIFWIILEKMISNNKTRLIALSLMAIVPVQIYYAHEGRMYALLMFLVLVAWLSILEEKWLMLALEVAALAYTQYVGIIYAGCLFLAGLIYNRRSWVKLTLAMLAGAIIWAPWIQTMIQQMSWIHGRHWIPAITIGDAIYNYAQMFFIAVINIRLEITGMIIFFSWLVMAVAYLFIYRPIHLEQSIILIILAFIPWLIEVVFSLVWQPILLHRTLIGVTPFLYILLATPAEAITRNRLTKFAFIAVLLPALITWYVDYYYNMNNGITPSAEFSKIIQSGWRSGDIVFHMGDSSLVETWPYTRIETGHVYRFRNCGVVIGGLTDLTRTAMGFPVMDLSEINYQRAWIITTISPYDPTCEAEYLKPFIQGIKPVKCFDDKYVNSCLYLVNK